MADGFNETPIRGKHRHNADPVDDTAAATLVAVATADNPSFIEGNMVGLSTDLAGRVRVVLSDPSEDAGANGLDVDVTDRAARLLGVVSLDPGTEARDAARLTDLRDSLLAGLESVDLNPVTRDDLVSRLTAAITDLRDTLSGNLEAVDLNTPTRDDIVNRLSTNLESVDLNVATRDDLVTRLSAALESVSLNGDTLEALERTTPQVRGADVGDDNPLPVNIQTNPGALYDSGLLTVADVAPGATVTLDGDDIDPGLTGRLVELTAASSVRIKVVLRSMGTTGARDQRVWFVDPTSSSLVYQPVDRDAITAAAGGRFRLSITNMDNLRTADVYGSLTHVEF